MYKKESYRTHLPHFQQPGQAYFVTWCLKASFPSKVTKVYAKRLEQLKNQINFCIEQKSEENVIAELKSNYKILRSRQFRIFDVELHKEKNNTIDLSLAPNREILADAFRFWENQKLNNWAWCIMPNHIHWVFSLNKHDERNNPVYLQDILQSVKRTTARKINEHYGLTGKSLWQKESYDTTVRDHVHLHRAIEYTLNNPVKAGLVKNQRDWLGSWQRIG